MRSRAVQIILTVLCLALAAVLLVQACKQPETAPETQAPATDPAPEETTPPQPDNEAPASETQPAPITPAGETPAPETPEAELVPTEPPAPAYGLVALSDEPVDDEWFSDAAFLGNSLVDGFRLFSGMTTCDYYAATSMTVLGAGSLISQMAAKQYGKVYILLGINEIGYDADVFKGQYSKMLDTIMEQQPDADIYIMGLSPVSEFKSLTDSTFTMTRVKLYNEKLLELAEEKECYYIDLVEALADETGYLPAGVTSDGVHFSAGHYQIWSEYLHTHHA